VGEDRTDRLGELRVPVLYTCGRHDEATPEATRFFQERTPGSRLEIFEESAHLPHAEESERYVCVVDAFLRAVDGKTE
jgi:proline iminopeptidase